MSFMFYCAGNRTCTSKKVIIVDRGRPTGFHENRRHLMRCRRIKGHVKTGAHIHPNAPFKIGYFWWHLLHRVLAFLYLWTFYTRDERICFLAVTITNYLDLNIKTSHLRVTYLLAIKSGRVFYLWKVISPVKLQRLKDGLIARSREMRHQRPQIQQTLPEQIVLLGVHRILFVFAHNPDLKEDFRFS